MSDDSQVTCPECHTTQSSEAPFCENCGYRIRRSDTVKEGHEAITSEMLRRVRRQRQAAGDDDQASADDGPEPADEPPGADGSAELASRSDADVRATLQDTPRVDGDEDDSKTYIEGLKAVDDSPSEEAVHSAADPSHTRPAPARDSGEGGPSAPRSASSRLPIYIAVWLSVTAVSVLATYLLTLEAATRDDTATEPVAVPERVEVPAGPFLRGLDDQVRSFILQMCRKVEEDPSKNCKQDKLLKGEYPQKTVELDAFGIDATEVVVGDYKKCVADDACEPIDYKNCEVRTHQGLQISLRVPKALQSAEIPVTCADLSQARAYCTWAGGSIPTADQWEKAARGEKGRLFPWGNSWGSDFANWGERDVAQNPIVGKLDGYERVAPPAKFSEGKSPYGVFDLAGNVAEWVDSGKKLQAHARGGSWTDGPFDLRATYRLELDPEDRRTDVGFRCVYPPK